MKHLLGLFGWLILASPLSAADLEVTLTQLSAKGGEVYLVLYQGKSNYDSNHFHSKMILPAKGEQIRAQFLDLEPGWYALLCFQDTNRNGVLDKTALGFPAEPIAASSTGNDSLGPPSFQASKFEINENRTITVTFKGDE